MGGLMKTSNFTFRNNYFPGVITDRVIRLKQSSAVYIEDNELEGVDTPFLEQFDPVLEVMSLSGNHLSGVILRNNVTAYKQLRRLDLSRNAVRL